jgi:hypothetical protein
MRMHQRPILSLGGKWNNGTLEWRHIEQTHQQAATKVRGSGRNDLGAEAAALEAKAAALQCPSNCGIVERTSDVVCKKQPVRKQLHVQSKLHPHAHKQNQLMKHANNTK